MFRITIMCQEKKLPDLLWKLDGLIVGKPEVDLVSNAAVIGGEVREMDGARMLQQPQRMPRNRIPGTRLPEKVAAYLIKEGFKEVTTDELRESIPIAGGAQACKNSIYYVKQFLLGHGIMKPTKEDGKYQLFPSKLPKVEG